jgi:hypothetical protein
MIRTVWLALGEGLGVGTEVAHGLAQLEAVLGSLSLGCMTINFRHTEG